MRSLLVVLLIFGMAIPSFAGGAYYHKEIRKEIVPEIVSIQQSDIDSAIGKHETDKHKQVAKLEKANGFAVGFYGDQTSLKLPELFGLNLEAGGVRANATRGFVKAWMNIFDIPMGITSFMDENNSSSTGLFLGLEHHLQPNLSIYADIYPVVMADPNNSYGSALFGGRLYF